MKNQTLHFIRGSALWLLNAHSLFLFIIIFIYLFFALFTQSALQIKLTQSPARDTQLITRKGKRLLSPGCVTPERESDGVCFTPTVSPSLCLLLLPLFHHYFLPEDKDFALQASYQRTPPQKKNHTKKEVVVFILAIPFALLPLCKPALASASSKVPPSC